MTLVILAAGYATRLYPQTLDVPKALLPVAGEPFLDRVLRWLLAGTKPDRIVVVCNSRFAPQFSAWRAASGTHPGLTVLDDGSCSNGDRLGAVGDLALALQHLQTEDDVLVAGSDRLCNIDVAAMAAESRRLRAPMNLCIETGSTQAIRGRHGCAVVAAGNRIIEFQEKPAHPASTLMSVACYCLPQGALALVDRYLDQGGDRDSLGNFLGWMLSVTDVYAWISDLPCLDIGTPAALAATRRQFDRGL